MSEGAASTATADAPRRPGRRALVRRVVTAAVLLWLLGLWLAQVLDRPGAPVAAGTIAPLESDQALGLGPASERRGVLAGVVYTADGEGAADALVTLVLGDELFWTHTDALGTFRLEGLAAGRATLAAVPMAAPGLDLVVELPLDGPLRIDLPPALPPAPTAPAIRRQSFEGVVRLPDGRDASGFEVALVPLESSGGGLRPVVAPGLDGRVERRATVDRTGRFRVDDLVLGSYQARVLPPFARGSSWPVIGSTTVEHDGRRATPIVDARPGAVEGRVLDRDGRPVPGALVQAASASDPALLLPSVRTDEEGAFAVEWVPEGALRLRARAGELGTERTVRVGPLRREQVELRLLLPGG